MMKRRKMARKAARLLLLGGWLAACSAGSAGAAEQAVQLAFSAPAATQATDLKYYAGGKTPASAPEAGAVFRDVAYADRSEKERLDIYLPRTGAAPYPVVLAFHGKGGDKSLMEVDGALMALARGYAVVTVNYREAEEARFPADVMDAKAAVRFVKANAAAYQLDKDRIAAWGDSFGGLLASFLGLTAAHPELDDLTLGNAQEGSEVRCVVAWFPALDDLAMDAEFARLGITPAIERQDPAYGEAIYGAPLTAIAPLASFRNPMRYVDAHAVPFYIAHGTRDDVCPVTQSEAFADRLAEAIGRENVTFAKVEGAGHHVTDFFGDDHMTAVFDFLDARMKGK